MCKHCWKKSWLTSSSSVFSCDCVVFIETLLPCMDYLRVLNPNSCCNVGACFVGSAAVVGDVLASPIGFHCRDTRRAILPFGFFSPRSADRYSKPGELSHCAGHASACNERWGRRSAPQKIRSSALRSSSCSAMSTTSSRCRCSSGKASRICSRQSSK